MAVLNFIYQQEINVLANSMNGRQMRNISKKAPGKLMYFIDT